MTKRQAKKIESYLSKHVDEPFLFAVRYSDCEIRPGTMVTAKGMGESVNTVNLFFAMIDTVFKNLNGTPEQNQEFRNAFIDMLTIFVKEEEP